MRLLLLLLLLLASVVSVHSSLSWYHHPSSTNNRQLQEGPWDLPPGTWIRKLSPWADVADLDAFEEDDYDQEIHALFGIQRKPKGGPRGGPRGGGKPGGKPKPTKKPTHPKPTKKPTGPKPVTKSPLPKPTRKPPTTGPSSSSSSTMIRIAELVLKNGVRFLQRIITSPSGQRIQEVFYQVVTEAGVQLVRQWLDPSSGAVLAADFVPNTQVDYPPAGYVGENNQYDDNLTDNVYNRKAFVAPRAPRDKPVLMHKDMPWIVRF